MLVCVRKCEYEIKTTIENGLQSRRLTAGSFMCGHVLACGLMLLASVILQFTSLVCVIILPAEGLQDVACLWLS
jgi:hypothetical protein